jgi:adenylate kinase
VLGVRVGDRRPSLTGLRALLIAPPGAGKGTQAGALSAEFGVPHVSTGALFRVEVAAATELGRRVKQDVERGDLVPDDVVEGIVRDAILKAVRETGGYLLDGFPRTLAQAHAAHRFAVELDLTAHAVLTFDVPRPVLLERLLGRAAQEGRTDDDVATIRHRLDVYDTETAPLLDYYAERGLLARVDANRSVDEVTSASVAALRACMAAAGD